MRRRNAVLGPEDQPFLVRQGKFPLFLHPYPELRSLYHLHMYPYLYLNLPLSKSVCLPNRPYLGRPLPNPPPCSRCPRARPSGPGYPQAVAVQGGGQQHYNDDAHTDLEPPRPLRPGQRGTERPHPGRIRLRAPGLLVLTHTHSTHSLRIQQFTALIHARSLTHTHPHTLPGSWYGTATSSPGPPPSAPPF